MNIWIEKYLLCVFLKQIHAKSLDLDDASEKSLNLMQTLANNAIDKTNQLISDDSSQDGQLIKSFLTNNSVENK